VSTLAFGAEYFAALLCPPSCESALIDEVLDRLGIDHLLYDLLDTIRKGDVNDLLKGHIQSLQKDGFIDQSRELTRFGRVIIFTVQGPIRAKLGRGVIIPMPPRTHLAMHA
jgi:hypothetical protein